MLKRLARTLIVLAAGAFAVSAAQAGDELGPPTGAALPHGLEALDSSGAEQSFETLAGENGLVLFFVRSVDWCPFCKAQALEVNEARGAFEARGLSVVIVSYDSVEKQAVFAARNAIGVTLLSDPESEIIDAFGLRNEAHMSGRFAGIPHPAVFIVGGDATILAKLYEEDFASDDKSYQRRPAVSAILGAADEALAAGQ